MTDFTAGISGTHAAIIKGCARPVYTNAFPSTAERDSFISQMNNPPRYDLPPGVIAGSDGKFYAPGDVVRTLPGDLWERNYDGRWLCLNHTAAFHDRIYEVRPTAANPLRALPAPTFRLPDGELACYRRDAAKLREAGAVLRNTNGGPAHQEYDYRYPTQVLLVEFPAQPKTDVIDTRLAKGRTLASGGVILQTGDTPMGGPWYSVDGRNGQFHAATVEVLATDGAL